MSDTTYTGADRRKEQNIFTSPPFIAAALSFLLVTGGGGYTVVGAMQAVRELSAAQSAMSVQLAVMQQRLATIETNLLEFTKPGPRYTAADGANDRARVELISERLRVVEQRQAIVLDRLERMEGKPK